ncbi:MAG: FixH family protein, partial [Pirellulaceae bacterium]
MSTSVQGDKLVASELGQPELEKVEWERRERRARRFWVGMILVLLLGSMSVWIGTAVVAINDPSMSVLPDYHQQALRWDEVQQERAASDRLGWEVRLGLEPVG